MIEVAKSRLVPRNTPDLEDHDELLEITHQSSRGGQEPPGRGKRSPRAECRPRRSGKRRKILFLRYPTSRALPRGESTLQGMDIGPTAAGTLLAVTPA